MPFFAHKTKDTRTISGNGLSSSNSNSNSNSKTTAYSTPSFSRTKDEDEDEDDFAAAALRAELASQTAGTAARRGSAAPSNQQSAIQNQKSPLRLLLITNLLPPHHIGGYELRCAQIAKALADRGHTVHILTSDHQEKAVPVVDPTTEPHVSRSLRLHGFYGHPWLPIHQLRELELHNNEVLRSTIASFQPDLIHVWNLGGISKSLIATLSTTPLPTVYDISDHWIARSLEADVWLDWWNRRSPSTPARLLRTWWKLSGEHKEVSRSAPTTPVQQLQFPHIYFCSAALKRLTAEKGYPVQHAAVIHCPVDTQRFSGPVAPPEQPLSKLLYVGRLAEDKGVLTALRAMALLPADAKGRPAAGYTLTVCGKGDPDYTAQLLHFSFWHQLPVHFIEASPADMPDVYRHHHALLFTSEWEEPFALTPLEAMASGLPVIGTLTGGSAELLKHEENSLTYPAGDPTELAARIQHLSAHPDLRHRIATTGQALVRQQLHEQHITDQIEAYLLCAAGQGAGRRAQGAKQPAAEEAHSSLIHEEATPCPPRPAPCTLRPAPPHPTAAHAS